MGISFVRAGREVDLSINTSDNRTLYNFDIIEPYVFNRKMSFIYGINYTVLDYGESASYDLTSFSTKTGFKYLLSDAAQISQWDWQQPLGQAREPPDASEIETTRTDDPARISVAPVAAQIQPRAFQRQPSPE